MTEASSRRSIVADAPGASELHVVQTAAARRRPSWLAWVSRPSDETLAAILLALAALATAWSSYQASIWSGIQAAQYNASTDLRTRAARAADDVARVRMLDLILFTKWLEADVDDRRRGLASMYRAHFRPEFRRAFDAWEANDRARAPASTPFDRPEYRVAIVREVERLDGDASRAVTAGQRANDISDGYVYDTVILACVLFFAGAVRPLVSPRARGTILLLGLALFAWAFLRLLNEPVSRLDAASRLLVRRSTDAADAR